MPTAHFVARSPFFPFLAGPICSSFFAKDCAILQDLCSRTCLPFLFCFPALASLSSPSSFLFLRALWQKLSSLPSLNIGLRWVPGHLPYFSRRTTRLISWPGGCALLVPSLFSLLSPHTLVCSLTGNVPFHLYFLTHRSHQFPLRNLCSFVTFAVSSLVFAATETAFC